MKKLFALILTLSLAFTLVACGSSNEAAAPQADNTQSTETTESTDTAAVSTAVQVNPVELVFFPATSADAGAYATVKIAPEIKLEDDAWLGLCPAGKDYVTELEADEADVVWFYRDGRESDEDPSVFACDFSDIEDGTYALVVANSDNAEVGYVVIQLAMTKADNKITFDYSDAKINEQPAE